MLVWVPCTDMPHELECAEPSGHLTGMSPERETDGHGAQHVPGRPMGVCGLVSGRRQADPGWQAQLRSPVGAGPGQERRR